MALPAFKVLLIADSTIDPLARFISQGRGDIDVSVAPYDQVFNALAGDLAGADLAVLFTQPHKVSSGFARALQYEPFDRKGLMAEFDAFAGLVLKAAAKVPTLAVVTWVPPPWALPAGLHSWQGPHDVSRLLAEANLKLAAAAESVRNLVMVDQAECLAGVAAFDPKLWAMGKVIYSRPALEAFARQIRSLIDAIRGRSRKLVVVDLDNTLWGGIVGDDGWQNLKLGGIDPVGESYALFQRQLKALQRRGILLAIASRNEESVALEAIRNHPEMVLGIDDFVARRINWHDKAANIADLARELNLGLQSVVFIDDNPAERDLVRQSLPEVLVPDWPADPAMFPIALKDLRCFQTLHLSEEDLQRTRMYHQERQRSEAMNAAGTRDEWLRSLGMRVQIRRLEEADLARATQLLNKTNQFNLATRRLAEPAFADWAARPGHAVLTFEVEDRFGAYGLVGLLGLSELNRDSHLLTEPLNREGHLVSQRGEPFLRIVDWVVSCRVLGRGVEETMLAAAAEFARRAECRWIVATYLPTPRNKPILAFLEALPAVQRRGDDFIMLPENCDSPEYVAVSGQSAQETPLHVDDHRR
jgi:FkbH-like protein